MSAKHTPGPWQGGFAITGSNGKPVCRVLSDAKWTAASDKVKYGCSGFRQATPEAEARANAALIAAAPAMLEALTASLEWLEAAKAEEPEDFENTELEATIARARSAIATAESQP